MSLMNFSSSSTCRNMRSSSLSPDPLAAIPTTRMSLARASVDSSFLSTTRLRTPSGRPYLSMDS